MPAGKCKEIHPLLLYRSLTAMNTMNPFSFGKAAAPVSHMVMSRDLAGMKEPKE